MHIETPVPHDVGQSGIAALARAGQRGDGSQLDTVANPSCQIEPWKNLRVHS